MLVDRSDICGGLRDLLRCGDWNRNIAVGYSTLPSSRQTGRLRQTEGEHFETNTILTWPYVKRIFHCGWSKVVGSGSNLVATPIISNTFPKGHPPNLSRQVMNYAARKLHGPHRPERAAESADRDSAPDRREARQRLLYHEPDRRLRANLSAAGMGVDRTTTFVTAVDGSRTQKVP